MSELEEKLAREGKLRPHILIESAGSSLLTRIYLVDRYGESHDLTEMVGVESARWRIGSPGTDDEVAKVDLTILAPHVEVKAGVSPGVAENIAEALGFCGDESRARQEERAACRGEALKELGKPVSPLTASRIADRIKARGDG